MKFYKSIFISFIILFILSFNVSNAALVNCGRTPDKPCTINDLFGNTTEQPFWINLIQTALGISGIIILCIFIYAGINLMISGGDKGKIKKARDMMIGSFVGIILVFFSFTIVKAGLMIFVGDKWSIYFGNSQVSGSNNTSNTSNTTPVSNKNNTNKGCTNDSSCLSTEYCCYNNRYDASNVQCKGSPGSCISKKKEFLKCKDSSECRSEDCYKGYCFGKVEPTTHINTINNGDFCNCGGNSPNDANCSGRCMYINSDSLNIFNNSGLVYSSTTCKGNTGNYSLVCIKEENYK
ncbi:MAG TPA: pilin [bacterium]|mgnify:FL=1|nr:pilin [bacterium]